MSPPQGLSRGQKVKFAFSSPANFHTAITLDSAAGKLINEDLVPSPPARWTWNAWSYLAYWWSEAWAVSTWSIGSSMVTLGMSVGDALLVVLFANILCAVIIVFNGIAAARYHVGFPVLARVVYGIYGSYFFVLLRSILGVIWGGVQLYFEGQFISVMLRCIFPSWTKIPNGIPASQHIDTQTMVGFVIAFAVTLPFMFVHTYKLRHVFTLKSFIVPLAGLGITIWATTANGGVSASGLSTAREPTSRIVYAFSVIAQFNSVMGSNSALLVTVPDFARYARSSRDQILGQMLGLPLSILCAAFGCITTSAVLNMYGEAYWNPYDLLNGILDRAYTPKSRAGVFFAAAAWAFATFGTSVACNIAPFAADITCLLPRYVNIIRGQFLCLVMAFAIVPWRILTSASSFLNFLGGYCIFQGSVVSIMIVDYLIVRRGNLDVGAMYTTAPEGKYYYVHGVNLRAIAAFIIGFVIPLPGFIGSFGTVGVSVTATRLYNLGWELSFLCGGLSYLLICVIWKVPGNEDRKRPFESMADDDWVLPGGEHSHNMPGKDEEEQSVGTEGKDMDTRVQVALV